MRLASDGPGPSDPWAWFIGVLVLTGVVLLILALSTAWPAELELWVTLPTKDADSVQCQVYVDSAGVLRKDRNAPGSPLVDLKWVRWYARRFKDAAPTLMAQDDVGGIAPGDSAGAVFSFQGGTMGEVWATAVDGSGNESCVGPSYVFAFPMDTTVLPTSPGLLGRYHRGMDFDWYVSERTDAQVDFAWGTGPPADAVPPDSFSVRWTGLLKVSGPGYRTIYANVNNGVRVWVSDTLKIDSWVDGLDAREVYGICWFPEAGSYPIRVEYFEGRESATMRLLWKVPSYTGTKGVVPASALEH